MICVKVEDDVVSCKTVDEVKCEEETVGYQTKENCKKWPKQECSLSKQTVTKCTTMTGCHKEPTELCAPKGCGHKEVKCLCFNWNFSDNPQPRDLRSATTLSRLSSARSQKRNVSSSHKNNVNM